MDATTLFFLIQAVTISIYLTLAIYILLLRSPRNIHTPFVLFALLEAFIAYSLFFNNSSGPSINGIALALRLRYAAIAFLPGLFLHMFYPLARNGHRRYAKLAARLAYGLGTLMALLVVFGANAIGSVIPRGAAGANLVDPVFDLRILLLAAAWVIPAIIAATLILVLAAQIPGKLRTRADAKRLLFPWGLLLVAALFGMISIFLPAGSAAAGLRIKMLEQMLLIVAGVMLARGILRFGSPEGQPINRRLLVIILPLAALVIVDFFVIYNSQILTSPLYLARMFLISLVAGTILARPELPQKLTRWLGPTPRDNTLFAVRLSLAWESLAEGSFDITHVSESLLAIGEEIGAAYTGVLELVEANDHQVLTFGRWEDGPRLTISAEHLDWPLTEESLREVEFQTSGVPSPPNVILPIHDDQSLAGVLVIGEPLRGSTYSRGDLQLAELLTSLLSFALSHGLRLEEAPSLPRTIDTESLALPDVAVVIRTFGRLEIFTQRAGTRVPRPSLRARQILAILLSAYPDSVPADTLMEQLWPEQPPDATANSLYVAIYALRRSLEPGLRRGAISRYVVREVDSYQLVIDNDLWVDYLEFLKLYWQGKDSIVRGNARAALRFYERALLICRHPFLMDSTLDLPAEVEVTRHQLQRFMHEMAWFLTQKSLARKDWNRAERAMLQLLSVDHHDQAAKDELANIYRQQGKEGLAAELEALGQGD